MQRKIVKQGKGAYTIVLPVDWVRRYRLTESDWINIEEKDEGKLIISCSLNDQPQQIAKLKITNNSELLIRLRLNHLYREGVNTIVIDYKNKKQEEIIKRIVEDLLFGFEISKESPSEITVECIAQSYPATGTIIVRNLFFVVKTLFEMINDNMKGSNKFSPDQIREQVRKADNYDNFSRRMILATHTKDMKTYSWCALYNYLKLCAHQLQSFNLDLNGKPSSELNDIFVSLGYSFSNLEKAFFNNNYLAIENETLWLRDSFTALIKKELARAPRREILSLANLKELGRVMFFASSAMLAITSQERS